MTIRKNSEISFPSSIWTSWSLNKTIEDKYFLTLSNSSSQNSNKFQLEFIDDKHNKLLRFNLINDSITMSCSKMLFNYDANKPKITRLVEYTISD